MKLPTLSKTYRDVKIGDETLRFRSANLEDIQFLISKSSEVGETVAEVHLLARLLDGYDENSFDERLAFLNSIEIKDLSEVKIAISELTDTKKKS